jgi:hypothetical protein
MKHLSLILSTIFAVAAPAVAADKLSLPWDRLGPQVSDRPLTITTNDQLGSYHGHCLRVEKDALVLENPTSPGQLLRIARQKITGIHVGARGRNLARLARGAGSALHSAIGSIFTPDALTGLVGTPVVAAYFVVATPFCAAGDLFARLKPPLDIEIVD